MVHDFLVINFGMIQLNNLRVGYYKHSIKLPSITGRFECGSITAIIGTNGVGKSTFLKTLAGVLPPVSGEIKFNMHRRPTISYLPQRISLNFEFPLTVFDVVAMGCWPKVGFLEKIKKDQKVIIWESLKSVKLHKIIRKDISLLSIGQFQCMLFARLLVQKASLILLDEPFNNVDNQTCDCMLSIIDQLRNNGSTIVVVIHNIRIVSRYFSNSLFLSQTSNIWKSYC